MQAKVGESETVKIKYLAFSKVLNKLNGME